MGTTMLLNRVANTCAVIMLVTAGVVVLLPSSLGGRAIEAIVRQFDVRKNWLALTRTAAVVGNVEGEPEFVFIGSYTCSAARRLHEEVAQLLVEYPDLTIGYLHGRRGEVAARAAICAETFGQFEQVHNLIYGSDMLFDSEGLQDLAERLDVTKSALDDCMADDDTAETLDSHAQWVQRATAATITPMLVDRNGKIYRGSKAGEKLLDRVRRRTVTL